MLPPAPYSRHSASCEGTKTKMPQPRLVKNHAKRYIFFHKLPD